MVEEEKTVAGLLDEMALKVMMVEPGDLSVVGEIVVSVEQLGAAEDIKDFSNLAGMAADLENVLGMIVMMELDDSAENFDHLGTCVVQMQEVHRKGDDDETAVRSFYEHLKAMGYEGGPDSGEPAPVSEVLESDDLDAAMASLEEPAPAVPPPARPQTAVPPPSPPVAPKVAAPFGQQVISGAPEIKLAPDQGGEVPDFMKDVDLLTGFVEEAFDHLESIEVNVLDLESNPDDQEIVNKIFRPFHTIKGVSGFLNLKQVQSLAHCTENLLDDVRNGARPMDANVIEVVLKVGDFLRTMVENIKEVLANGPESYKNYDISEFVTWVKQVQSGESAAPQAAPPVAPSAPAAAAPAAPTSAPAAAPPASGPPTAQAAAAPPPPPRPAARPVAPPPAKPKSGAPSRVNKKPKVGASIKVDIEKLDGLVNAVGELVIMQAMVRANPLISQVSDPKLTKDFAQLSRITSELQKTAMSMRMVPIRQTFQKMIRLVRDLSKKTGKNVDLVMKGEETEIDRNMVDSIYDPLVHMMRNSVDHGVQIPAERESLGKPGKGTVHLRAYQKGGNMVIEIEDDGQGLNTAKIRQKALERDLIAEHDNLTDHELNNLIFLPGFSTADQITDVSGRGVGMDVVKKAVEKLRGKVEVFSESGNGSQFVIRLPLTLAIIDGIIVRVGKERYIIPTTAIQESLKPRDEQYNTVHGRGETLMIRETLVPIIRLYEIFGVEPVNTDPCQGIVVVVEAEGKQRAILVDELLGKQEVVIKNLGGLQDIQGVAGGTILGDGQVGLILDLVGLINSTTDQGEREALAEAQ